MLKRAFLFILLSSPNFGEIFRNDLSRMKVLIKKSPYLNDCLFIGFMSMITTRSMLYYPHVFVAINQYGPIYLYYGCREKASQLFRNELDKMMQHKVITKTFVAFSREIGKQKVSVTKTNDEIFNLKNMFTPCRFMFKICFGRTVLGFLRKF